MGIFDTTGLLGTWRANVLRDNSEFTADRIGSAYEASVSRL